MREGLVTVVVPVYNVEKYLDRCIESIVNQTYTDLEIILVDDGSPDRCPQMCDEWAQRDARIKVIHKANAGLGMARNTGIENATGEFICFFDSDDFVDTTTIEKARRQAREENAEIVVFGMRSVDKHGNVVKSYIPETPIKTFSGADVQQIFLPDLIENGHTRMTVKNMALSACSGLFAMNLIERVNWRFVSERLCISEDSLALLMLYRYVDRVTVLTEALYFYCENEASLTRTYRADRFGRIKQFYIDAMHLAEEYGYNQQVKKRISGLFISFVIAAIKQICAADLNDKQKKLTIRDIVRDDVMRDALDIAEFGYESSAKNLMCRCMRRRWYEAIWLCVRMQGLKERFLKLKRW